MTEILENEGLNWLESRYGVDPSGLSSDVLESVRRLGPDGVEALVEGERNRLIKKMSQVETLADGHGVTWVDEKGQVIFESGDNVESVEEGLRSQIEHLDSSALPRTGRFN